jgi:hypothetical protein
MTVTIRSYLLHASTRQTEHVLVPDASTFRSILVINGEVRLYFEVSSEAECTEARPFEVLGEGNEVKTIFNKRRLFLGSVVVRGEALLVYEWVPY